MILIDLSKIVDFNNPISVVECIVSIAGILLFALSVQPKKKKHIILMQALAAVCYSTVYFIKGAWTSIGTEIYETIKDFVFLKYLNKNRDVPRRYLYISTIVLAIIGIYTWTGIHCLLPLIINFLYTLGTYLKNPKYIRRIVFFCAIMWLIYNYRVGAYVFCIGNVFEISSAAIAIIRNKKNDDNFGKPKRKRRRKRKTQYTKTELKNEIKKEVKREIRNNNKRILNI